MKKLFLLAALICSASLASAQETYSVAVGGTTTNRNSVLGQIQLGRQQNNDDVCVRGNLAKGCTQAQACVALLVTGGASCSVADAIAANARIYPDSLAGRESFVANHLVRFRAPIYLDAQIVIEQQTVKTWCTSASQADLNTVCALAGLAAGCKPCY
jgi:hypothetical protein